MKLTLFSAAAATVLVACGGPPRIGVFGPSSFDLTRDHYRIAYAANGTLLPEDWRLDNFVLRGSQSPVAKWAPEYTRGVAPDFNGDGRVDRYVTIPRYDLSYVHARDGATLWLQTTPVSARIGERDLDVIARDFVDRVGGGSYIEVDWGAGEIRDRRMGTVIREDGPVTIDGEPGHWVTFEFVSVDQRTVDATHQGELVTVVLLRPHARWTPNEADGLVTAPSQLSLPILMTVGYASRFEHHETHRAEFEDLLRRIDLHDPSDDTQ